MIAVTGMINTVTQQISAFRVSAFRVSAFRVNAFSTPDVCLCGRRTRTYLLEAHFFDLLSKAYALNKP